ncbi:hypothetical protein [Arthrobacter oryzae]|uniref:Uncharacterized protein n=1 Tax=Arthrobacter oryzae TaxID=409290 RepID=A0A495EAW0_9MICC|nr:hypothetical protein [Arthrobacter oryzae]RKR13956.1 hypothetical protein C8D78_3299 [Arthrobacter oryzae]
MTEPNHEPSPGTDQADQDSGPGARPMDAAVAAQSLAADVAWPVLPSQLRAGDGHGHQTHGARTPIKDPAVSAVLDRLAALQQTPVSGHGELYAGMHDALLEALNEDLASHAGLARRIHAAGTGDREPA